MPGMYQRKHLCKMKMHDLDTLAKRLDEQNEGVPGYEPIGGAPEDDNAAGDQRGLFEDEIWKRLPKRYKAPEDKADEKKDTAKKTDTAKKKPKSDGKARKATQPKQRQQDSSTPDWSSEQRENKPTPEPKKDIRRGPRPGRVPRIKPSAYKHNPEINPCRAGSLRAVVFQLMIDGCTMAELEGFATDPANYDSQKLVSRVSIPATLYYWGPGDRLYRGAKKIGAFADNHVAVMPHPTETRKYTTEDGATYDYPVLYLAVCKETNGEYQIDTLLKDIPHQKFPELFPYLKKQKIK